MAGERGRDEGGDHRADRHVLPFTAEWRKCMMKTPDKTHWLYLCLLIVLALLLTACEELLLEDELLLEEGRLVEKGALPDEVKDGVIKTVERSYPQYDFWTVVEAWIEEGDPLDSAVDEVFCCHVTVAHTDDDSGEKGTLTLPVLVYRTGSVWAYDDDPGPDDWLRNACPGALETVAVPVEK
jgi:hypothetical protein